MVGSDAGALQPHGGAARGVDFHRESDDAEERGHGKQADAEKQKGWKRLHEQDASQQNPRHHLRGHRDDRYQGGTQAQRPVGRGVLNGMATLMGRNSGGGHGSGIENAFAEVHRLVGGVVVVSELSWRGNDRHVIDAVVVQHFFRHLAARQTRSQRLTAETFELVLQVGLHGVTQ